MGRQYSDDYVEAPPATSFLADFGDAVKGIPEAVGQWWRDAHTWDRPKDTYEIQELPDTPEGGVQSILTATPDPDYVLWKRLRWVEWLLAASILTPIGFVIGEYI